MSYLLVFMGAGIGGVCRFCMSPAVQRLGAGWIFPIGTLSVNVLGCFLIGLLGQIAESRGIFQGETRLFLFVGILGGFTTFSSFGYETVQLLRDNQLLYAATNAVLQLILGVASVWLGSLFGRLSQGG